MIIKKIKYEDYDGNQREEEFYFNLSRAEIMKMEMSVQGGLDAKIKRLGQTKDAPEVMQLFEDIIAKAYGVKSLDGKRMVKSKELSEEFMQTEAYSELLMELLSSPEAASEFINGVVAKDKLTIGSEVDSTNPVIEK